MNRGQEHQHRRIHRIRAVIRAVLFTTMVIGFSLWSSYVDYHQPSNDEQDAAATTSHLRHERLLLSDDNATSSCSDADKIDPKWMCILYFMGVLYMFLAIAIVCDELFVPTLEEMASERHLNLSMDVTGATLMAAGGSAPELFTSIFGTFVTKSEVGIGTVVGSAVFNVLFVISMCALLARELLELTWWPLFRDSCYYSLGLTCLGIFVGVTSPSEIQFWEALVLFLLYLGYVTLMIFNRTIYRRLTGRELEEDRSSSDSNSQDEEEVVVVELSSVEDTHPDQEVALPAGSSHEESSKPPATTPTLQSEREKELDEKRPSSRSLISIATSNNNVSAHSTWPGTFRSGILKLLLRDPAKSWMDAAGVGIVAVLAGDVHHVFRQLDVDSNGQIDKEELALLFAKLDQDVSQTQLDQVMEQLDENNDGRVTQEDFTIWYIHSEQQILSKVRTMFDSFDTDKSGTIDRNKVRILLETVEPAVTEDDIDQAMSAMYQHGSREEISFDEFSNWYMNSMIYHRQTKRVQEELGGIWESVKLPPSDNRDWVSIVKYIGILPIVFVLAISVPDVRRPGFHKYCYLSFFLSIAWIGFFSYFMVDWAELIGHTAGIPSVIMGLTLLAAGTSVPDLLTSVIVARMGEGDMALSSSIGSNIFDILVGLPLPWAIYTAWNGTTVTIGSDNVWIYIFTLLGMLVFVVIATHCQGWKLTRTLAILMLLFYFGFLALAIWLELPFEVC